MAARAALGKLKPASSALFVCDLQAGVVVRPGLGMSREQSERATGRGLSPARSGRAPPAHCCAHHPWPPAPRPTGEVPSHHIGLPLLPGRGSPHGQGRGCFGAAGAGHGAVPQGPARPLRRPAPLHPHHTRTALPCCPLLLPFTTEQRFSIEEPRLTPARPFPSARRPLAPPARKSLRCSAASAALLLWVATCQHESSSSACCSSFLGRATGAAAFHAGDCQDAVFNVHTRSGLLAGFKTRCQAGKNTGRGVVERQLPITLAASTADTCWPRCTAAGASVRY
jgi:hypothetical protein